LIIILFQVIRALHDYDASTEGPGYLSFSQGDFLHVVGRENDVEWYDACNPLQGTRGLVRVNYFETVGKTATDSTGSANNNAANAPHDSGYSDVSNQGKSSPGGIGGIIEGYSTLSQSPAMQSTLSQQGRDMNNQGNNINPMGGAGLGPMVYGIVSYDFHAERPDELDAKAGEAIIVIAQSNPEWFVAKPITRLGGPGLIPVSFVAIKDMQTGQTIEDTASAVAKAKIPKVEEWKKMAADYKNTSIPLGQFGSGNSNNSADGVQQRMSRMSLTNNNSNSNSQSASPALQQQTYQYYGPPAPVTASVPRFAFADDKFHFIIECTMTNGSYWDLSRIYEDFYELQINLIRAFPDEAGSTGQQRILPYMPGPVQFINDGITEGRRQNLNEYLQHLLRLGDNIKKSSLVLKFFNPRQGDYEIDPNTIGSSNPVRRSTNISNGMMGPPLTSSSQQQQQRYSQSSLPPQSSSNSNSNSPQVGYGGHQQQHQQQQHQRQLSSVISPRSPYQQQQSSISSNNNSNNTNSFHKSQTSTGSQSSQLNSPYVASPLTSSLQSSNVMSQNYGSYGPSSYTKIKVRLDEDNTVILKMTPKNAFTFDQLLTKIAEKRDQFKGMDSADTTGLEAWYRDDTDKLQYRISNDDDLQLFLENNENYKLTLERLAD